MIFIWILILVIVYYLFKNHEAAKTVNHGEYTPEEILKQRYINGEIDEETFIRMNKTIK